LHAGFGGEGAETRGLQRPKVRRALTQSIVASMPSPRQDLGAFLLALFSAVHLHGCPEALVSDGGSVFRANQALRIYDELAMCKERIERRRPWQNYVETHFAIMKRMADYGFAQATSWDEFCAVHARFVADYNFQAHFAHQDRVDGLRSPSEVLGWVHGRHVDLPTLDRIFHATRVARHLDRGGYLRYRHWRLYGEEGLAGREASVWLFKESLTITFAREPLAEYAVTPATDRRQFAAVREVQFFPSRYPLPQPRLWDQQIMGEVEWRRVLKLHPYVRRHTTREQREPRQLQLFG